MVISMHVDSDCLLVVPCQSWDLAKGSASADLMWQWPSGEMVSWERSAPSRASMRPVSTIFPLLGYTVRRTILAPLPFSGIVCARAADPLRGSRHSKPDQMQKPADMPAQWQRT